MGTPGTFFSDTKRHYQILDGLRGVAALVVVVFHILEAFSIGNPYDQIINHGYLAVDFFFLLSGFVIGYAYDDRWGKMSLKDFFKRRLIRLHPMIILGMLLGGLLFYYGASTVLFPLVNDTPVWKLILITLVGMTLVPVLPSMDIRGWSEMHPVNGPAWTLFFEYVGNILYALIFRHLSKTVLIILTVISGGVLLHWGLTSPMGFMAGGWSFDGLQLRIGFTRLLYPFLAGLLMSRTIKPGSIKNAFLWSSLLLVIILALPRFGDKDTHWINGLYEALAIIVVFPVIVYMGASGSIKGKVLSRVCNFLGDISYPIYITHYVFIYIITAWVVDNQVSYADGVLWSVVTFVVSVAVAYGAFKFYDLPVRRWLTQRWVKK
ncbi:MAG TPA: acyltransferase [Cytophagales bacterium]|nr:acyltransferase [Cytophagales bacterium]HAA21480.1 acyltransferase [Cytophagales bacterium]HAP65215.1 acyltransferase [Cytophagales bacterium]